LQLDTFAFVDNDNDRIDQVRLYLEPLLNFSKEVLIDKHYDWTMYPIYLKATGGLRALPRPYRVRLIETVRTVMHDTSFNPFFFEDE
jgi:GDA1/CD39 (nucleoside phosphatase) family